MRTLIAAVAAFLTASGAAFAQSPVNTFAGCYVGAHAGYTANIVEVENAISLGVEGGLVGIQGGCDAAMDRAVVGLYGEYNFLNADQSVFGQDIKMDSKWSAGIRGGLLLNPGTLLYAKIAYTKSKGDILDASGVDMGAGLEVALTQNLFLQADYTYTKWKEDEEQGIDIDTNQHTGRLGVIYKFNTGFGGSK